MTQPAWQAPAALWEPGRLLWIVNHRTLLLAEVPILRSLGWEVFIPKIVPDHDPRFRSAAVTHDYDHSLKLPHSALRVLNGHDFYERAWSPTVEDIINTVFQVVIVHFSYYTTAISEPLRKFCGQIVARAFGREHPRTYAEFADIEPRRDLLNEIAAAGPRFIFGQGYANLAEVEPPEIRQRAHTITVPLPKDLYRHADSWRGGGTQAVFLCPAIRPGSYYGTIYEGIKRDFGDLPHVIFGRRPERDHMAQGVDAIVAAGDHDLVVPMEEAGLLARILRHGPDAIQPGVRAVLRDRLQPGAVAVDAGANIGIHTLTMASATGVEGRVIGFEPLPHRARALRRAIRLNGFAAWAEVHQTALADSLGEVTVRHAAHGPVSSPHPQQEAMETQPLRVRAITLDDCLAPGSRVDLVRLAVEGAEPMVWRGMQRVLRDNPGIGIVLAWSAPHIRSSGEDPAAFMAQIHAAGFFPFVIMDQPGGGLMPPSGDMMAIETCALLLTRHGQAKS
jgi:FkbM family methyltransferase